MGNSSMSTIDLEVEAKDFKFYCSLKRRLTVIRGDSGVGKTSLVDRLQFGGPGVKIACPLDVRVSNESTWDAPLRSYKNTIIFYDDLYATETLEFASLCKETLVKNNLYVVIINRSGLENFEQIEDVGHKYVNASISVTEIYDFKNNGIEHWLEPAELPVTTNYKDVDCVLVEDRGNGKKFFDTYLSNVIAATSGKSSIVSDLEDLVDKYSKILVQIDLAAFGCHWEAFTKKILSKYNNVFVLPNRECFEHMLLRSNLLKDNPVVVAEMSDPVKNANWFISWEKYYEKLIKVATYEKFYRCTHGRHPILSDCYLCDCSSCNPEKKARCDFIGKNLPGCKFDILFEDTEFSDLLDLPRRSNSTKTMQLF